MAITARRGVASLSLLNLGREVTEQGLGCLGPGGQPLSWQGTGHGRHDAEGLGFKLALLARVQPGLVGARMLLFLKLPSY